MTLWTEEYKRKYEEKKRKGVTIRIALYSTTHDIKGIIWRARVLR